MVGLRRTPGGANRARNETRDLLQEAAAEMGFAVSSRWMPHLRSGAGCYRIALRDATRECFLDWPPIPPVYKSAVPAIVDGLRVLRAVTTVNPRGTADPPWLPCCLKPDDGSLGEGFVALREPADWERAVRSLAPGRRYVAQPLLSGIEYRITTCWDGQYAVARLDGRRGRWCLWADATEVVPRDWIYDFIEVAHRLHAPALGCDVIVGPDGPRVLDINAAPNLAIHVVTNRPRNVARAYLESWLAMDGASLPGCTSGV